MGTKNISLPTELEAYIDAKVASGEYAHASEVVRDGIRLMMREEAEKLEWLRNAIAEAIASADRGELYDGDEVIEHVKRRGREILAREGRSDAV
jgi:antitoxin ParD1/3/4